MKRSGGEELPGRAVLTPAFNLPSRFVLHTVGPIVRGAPTEEDCRLLASCYRACPETAEQAGIGSLAICCISTGEFRFPRGRAAEIAVGTVRDYRMRTGSKTEVIFNIFSQADFLLYRALLR